MPLLLRQSFRSSVNLTRGACRPAQAQFRPAPSAFPARPTLRSFSVCLQCQFRRQLGSYFPLDDKDKASNDAERLVQAAREAPDAIPIPEVDAGGARAADPSTAGIDGVNGQSRTRSSDKGPLDQQEEEQSANFDGALPGGLPSYLESRRSKLSKQFTTMMDNLQSNVFVAGQRLNDLTGYSGIEALKNEIHSQGTQHASRTNKPRF